MTTAPRTAVQGADGGGMGQFGQDLRREREDRGVSIDEICAITKVSSRHVEALEADRYADLPGGVFRKGILRSYIAAVGLEEAVWIERFEASLRASGTPGPDAQDWAEFAENVRRNRGRQGSGHGLRWLGVLLMLLALALCGWLVWRFVLHERLPGTAACAPASTVDRGQASRKG